MFFYRREAGTHRGVGDSLSLGGAHAVLDLVQLLSHVRLLAGPAWFQKLKR